VGIAAGRVNLIGDHVDYAGGLVLPMAIDRWTVAAGDWSADPRRPRLFAVDLDEAAQLDLTLGAADDSEHVHGARVGHWSGYIAGVYLQTMLLASREHAKPALDLAITSTVPRASGLSSSAALEVAVATLLDHAWQLETTADELALACQHAEHVGGGVQCGMMDQFASVMGVADHAIMIDCGNYEVTPMRIAPTLAVLVVDTRTPRQLTAGKYGELFGRMQKVKDTLGPSLRGLTLERVEASNLDARTKASAAHYVEETAAARAAAGYLGAGDAHALARVMLASHASLRDRLGVSCPELEAAVAGAASCGPDVGARLTGAGMGGCAVIVCPGARAAEVAADVRTKFAAAIGRPCDVLRVRAVDGAAAI
jgi:galactokinase